MNDDAKLLHRYAHERSEAAFTELVRLHVDLVYSAALRRCNGDTQKAEDVVQQVFTALARNAKKLASHPALDAWLYAATRNAVINLALAEQRRAQREQEAAMSGLICKSSSDGSGETNDEHACERIQDWRGVAGGRTCRWRCRSAERRKKGWSAEVCQ